MKRLAFAILAVVTLAGAGASAQTAPPQQLPISENPVKLGVTNWGSDWVSEVWLEKYGGGDEGRNAYYLYANIAKPGYFGSVNFAQTLMDYSWRGDSLRAMAQRNRYFSKTEIEFGTFDSVDNGAAEYKYIMMAVTDNGKKLSCAYFAAEWRNRRSFGSLCADDRVPPLTEATVEAYIKGLSYRDWLSPSGSVTLPLAGDNRG